MGTKRDKENFMQTQNPDNKNGHIEKQKSKGYPVVSFVLGMLLSLGYTGLRGV